MNADDTGLDAIAAQVRSLPPLPAEEVHELLGAVQRSGDRPAQDRLVEHHLGIPLREALVRGNRGLDVFDLYQEGTVATIVAIAEYAARSDAPEGLSQFVSRVVSVHLDHALEAAAIERQEEEAFVRDAQLYETAEVSLRHRLGREAAVTELAAALDWPEDRVAIVAEQIARARELYDSDIVPYLDDDADDED
ncbi:MAG: hypothetical protein JOY68_03430 [Candidatus Dormibacteraeota bacterium]|nr:hypothetical protein [Candidatus Dormibacteraeota bacterium]MBV8445676.1 hypothetical protein [Candidatus Dormibacteraeota bacterium]